MPNGAPSKAAAAAQAPLLADAKGRSVSYLRLSVTDRCNLRCLYCDRQMRHVLSHDDILRYEELIALMGLAGRLGIGKVRLTGGEPFARRGFMEFLEAAREAHPALALRLTTNGTLLAPFAPRLAAAGVDRVNISLDTLDRERFARITGQDLLHAVMAGMDACLEAGIKVKLNAVALRGINDDELAGFLDLATRLPVDVRFIEFMPMGGADWGPEQVWPAADILAQAGRLAGLSLLPRDAEDAGPAQMYAIKGGAGRFGLITPLSSHFCATCNRLRITSGGVLRTCLFSDRTYRLRPALRHPRLGLGAVERILRLALRNKPVGADLLAARRQGGGAGLVCATAMSSIGG